MKVWDMHCDTLAELRYAQQAGKPKSFLHNDLMIDLERMKQGDYLLQCMACFVHLEPEREKSPLLACLEEIDIFYRLLEQYPDDLMQVRTAADIQTLLTSGCVAGSVPPWRADDDPDLELQERLGRAQHCTRHR